jgi:hypothetical protein
MKAWTVAQNPVICQALALSEMAAAGKLQLYGRKPEQ